MFKIIFYFSLLLGIPFYSKITGNYSPVFLAITEAATNLTCWTNAALDAPKTEENGCEFCGYCKYF